MMRFVMACVLIAGFFWLALPSIRSTPYSYDEADYMYAASRGFAANYLDRPAQSFGDFLRTGLSRGRDAAQKTALSQAIRDSGDINFYRHWHGPLYYYWLVLLQPFSSDEYMVRALSLVFPALALLVIYFGSIWTFAGEAQSAAFLAAALYGWSAVTVSSTELAPHQLFVLIFSASLLLMARSIETGRQSYWYGAVVLGAGAVATLEVGLILVFTLAAAALLHRRRLAADWRFAGRSVALLILSLVAVWPGALLRLAVAKAWLFMAYLAVVRKAAWGATFSQAWAARGTLAPIEWILFAGALWLFVRDRETRDDRVVPFLIFGCLMLLFLLRVNATGARYMLPFLPAFDVFAAVTIVRWMSRRHIKAPMGMAVAACLVLLLNTLRIENARAQNTPDSRPLELLSKIRERHLDDKTVLIPHDDFPMLHYYFPNARFIAYGENSDGPPLGTAADALISEGDPVRIVTY